MHTRARAHTHAHERARTHKHTHTHANTRKHTPTHSTQASKHRLLSGAEQKHLGRFQLRHSMACNAAAGKHSGTRTGAHALSPMLACSQENMRNMRKLAWAHASANNWPDASACVGYFPAS